MHFGKIRTIVQLMWDWYYSLILSSMKHAFRKIPIQTSKTDTVRLVL